MKRLIVGTVAMSLAVSSVFALSNKVEVKKSVILNQTTMVGSKNTGNAGIAIKGKNVKVDKSVLLNKTTMVGSQNSGNAGVQLGDDK